MAAPRLYQVTLRAAQRRIGSTVLVRGQSLTFPISADVSRFTSAPHVWDVKVVTGHRPRQEPTPGTRGGAPVSPRASAAFTGLVNRLAEAAATAQRLEAPDVEGYRAMLRGSASDLGAYLARALAGEGAAWARLIADPSRLPVALELLDELEDAEAQVGADELEIDPEALAALPVDRGAEADAADPEAEAEAERLAGGLDTMTAPPPPVDHLAAFRAALVGLQEGQEGVTMRQVLELAKAAGLEVPPELHRVRRRDDLATALAQLLAAATPTPRSSGAHPSPAELED